jgi:succinate dehydrogenase/fumarate reductase flavoprotein subunit
VKRQTGWEVPNRDEFPEFNNEGGTDYIYFGGKQGNSRLWLRLRGALMSRGIEVRYSTAAQELVTDKKGRVSGVRVSTPQGEQVIEARRGVVLACGGFENNPEMIRKYLGIPYATPWGSPANTGDGIRMGQALGADLQNMYQYMPFFGIRIPGEEVGEFIMPAGPAHIHVRKDGRRYLDETTPYSHGKSKIGGKYEYYPTPYATWTVFDETVRTGPPLTMPREAYPAGWLKLVKGYTWSEGSVDEIAKGWIAKADTIRELAEKLGVDPDGLEAEVARYNAAAEQGEDPYFGRPGVAMAPIKEPPYYGYEWGNLIINTMGGLRKNGKAQVLRVSGDAIPGLYAAGEIASTYTWVLSGGQSIGDAISFGRIAGRNAANGKG